MGHVSVNKHMKGHTQLISACGVVAVLAPESRPPGGNTMGECLTLSTGETNSLCGSVAQVTVLALPPGLITTEACSVGCGSPSLEHWVILTVGDEITCIPITLQLASASSLCLQASSQPTQGKHHPTKHKTFHINFVFLANPDLIITAVCPQGS